MRLKLYWIICVFWCIPCLGQSISQQLSLSEVIKIAQSQSIESMLARNQFLSDYWAFRAFRAEQLPSLNLQGNVGSFNRSLIPLQNSETGSIAYRSNFNMSNGLTLSIDQNIAFTGGTLSLYSSLTRLDQYSPMREIMYYSQPITLSYLQPLWSFNQFKWDRKIEPERYEKSKRAYLEAMEDVTLNAVKLFFELALEQINCDIATKNYENTRNMYTIAQQRFELGSVKQSELMQLELSMLNDSAQINTSQLQYNIKCNQLRSYLGYTDVVDLRLELPDSIPMLFLKYDEVLQMALKNSSFVLEQKIQELEAEMGIDQARGNRGISFEIRTQFGLSQSANKLYEVYRGLIDQEIFGLTFRIPIMDWGMGKGRVRMARAQAEVMRNKIMRETSDFHQDIFTKVMYFNSQSNQCRLARYANSVADKRYAIAVENFMNGTMTVADLNTAQSEKDEAHRNYINQLQLYWEYYYQLRKNTLYDFMSQTNISAEFDLLVK